MLSGDSHFDFSALLYPVRFTLIDLFSVESKGATEADTSLDFMTRIPAAGPSDPLVGRIHYIAPLVLFVLSETLYALWFRIAKDRGRCIELLAHPLTH